MFDDTDLFRTKAEKYRDNPFRELSDTPHRTDWFCRKIFADGSTYHRDFLTEKVNVKKPPLFW